VLTGDSTKLDPIVALSLLDNFLTGANTVGGKPMLSLSQAVDLIKSSDLADILNDASLKTQLPENVKQLILFKDTVEKFEIYKNMFEDIQNGVAGDIKNEFKSFVDAFTKLTPLQQKELLTRYNIREEIFNQMKDAYLKANPTRSREYFEINLKSFLVGERTEATEEIASFVVKQLTATLSSESPLEDSVSYEFSGQEFKTRSLVEGSQESKKVFEQLGISGFVNPLDAKLEDVQKIISALYPTGILPSGQNANDLLVEINGKLIDARFKSFIKMFGISNDQLMSDSLPKVSEAKKLMLFNFNDLSKKQLTIEEFNKLLKTKEGKAEVIKTLFNNNKLNTEHTSVTLGERVKLAITAHYNLFVKDTVIANGNGALYIDLSSFQGKRMAQLSEAIKNNPNNVLIANKQNSVEDIVKQFFIDNPDEFLVELQKERANLARLHRKYPGGFIVFENVGAGSFPEELGRIFDQLNYGKYDLNETLGVIPGVYYKSSGADSAIQITFNSPESKALLLNFLKGQGSLENSKNHLAQMIKIAEDEGKYDFKTALDESVGMFTTVKGDTVINVSGNAIITDIDPNTMRFSELIDTVIAKDLTIKQGRNAGNLIKMFLQGMSGYGLVSAPDVTLRNNMFLISAIRLMDDFQQGTFTNLSDVQRKFTQDELKLFRDSGLWEFVTKVGTDTVTMENPNPMEIWIIKPAENFKQKALDYLSKNSSINPIVIVPLLKNNLNTQIAGVVGYNEKTGTTALSTNFLNYIANNFIKVTDKDSFNSFFIQDSVDIKFTGQDKEQEFLSDIKGKTVDFILKDKELGKKYFNNIYYQMLSNVLNGSLKIYESVKTLFADNKVMLNLFDAIGDQNIRSIIGEGLNKKLSSETIAENVNRYLKAPKHDLIFKDYKDTFIQRVGVDKNDAVISAGDVFRLAPSFVYDKALNFEASDIDSIKSMLTKGDVFINNAVLGYQSIDKQNLSPNDFFIIKSMLEQSSNNPTNGINFFVSNLQNLNQNQFNLLIKTLTDFGTDAKTINLLKEKYNQTEQLFATVLADKETRSRQVINDIADPTFEMTDTYTFYDNPNSNRRALNEAVMHARNMAFNPSSKKSMLKVNQTENMRGNMAESMKRLSDLVRINNRANNEESRLIPNLALTAELGNLGDSLTVFTDLLMKFNFGSNIKLNKEQAYDLAWNMYLHSTGTDMSKHWTKYLFYDTKEKRVVSLANEMGHGRESINKLMEVSAQYFDKKEAGRYILFSMDKNMLHNSMVATGGNLKYMLLDEGNIDIMKDIFVKNAYVQSEEFNQRKNPTPEELKQIVSKTYSRSIDLGDIKDIALKRFEGIKGITPRLIEKLFLSMSTFKGNFNLNEQAFENTVLLGGDYSNEQKERINLKQQYANDVLRYMIHHSELPNDLKNELSKVSNNILRENKQLLDALKIKASDVEDLNDYINRNDFFSFNNKIKAILGDQYSLAKNAGSNVRKLFNLIINYNILSSRDGKSLNFLLNESNIDLLQRKDNITNVLTETFTDGTTKNITDILREGFNVLDIEAFYGNKLNESSVFQVVFKTYDGITDVQDFLKTNKQVSSSNKQVIYVPVFIDIVENGVTKKVLWNRALSKNKDYTMEKIFPDYYKEYYNNPNVKGAKIAVDEYFNAMDLLPKNFSFKDLNGFIEKQIKDNGKITLTYNGKAFDVGNKSKDKTGKISLTSGLLLQQKLISDNFFVFDRQLDVLTDLVRNQVLIDRAFNDSSSLDNISKYLGLDKIYTNNHEGETDADITAEVAVRFINQAELIKLKQTDLFDLIKKIGDNFFLKDTEEVDYTKLEFTSSDKAKRIAGQKDSLLSFRKVNTDLLDDRTKEFINDYRTLFDTKEGTQKVTALTKAINETINDLNYYYYKLDFDVQKKKAFYELDNLYESQKDYIDSLQNGGSKRLGSILEYLLYKLTLKPLDKVFPEFLDLLKGDFDSKQNGIYGTVLRQLFDLLKDSFGVDRVGEDGESYKSFDGNQFRYMAQLSEEEFFRKLKPISVNIFGVNLDDFKDNQSLFQGNLIKELFNKLSNSPEGKQIRNLNSRNSLSYKLINNITPIFNELLSYSFLGDDKSNLRIKLAEEFSTFTLRDKAMSNEEFTKRIANKRKFIDSPLVQYAKEFVLNRNVIEIDYDRLYQIATPAMRNQKYNVVEINRIEKTSQDRLINAIGLGKALEKQEVISRKINSNEIGIKLETLLKLTSLKTIEQVYNLYPNGEIYIPIMRHPGDHVGSVNFYKVVILDDSNVLDVALNEDIMKGIMFGDFDGDHITILKPDVEIQQFAKEVDPLTKIAYKAIDFVLKDDTAFKFESSAQSFLIDNKLSNIVYNNFLFNDYQIINNQKTSVEKINKYNDLKKERVKFISDTLKITDQKQIDSLLELTWINFADVSNAFTNKQYVFYSLNKNFGSNKDNIQAIRDMSLAKSFFFEKQALNDTVYGQIQKSYANLPESTKSKKTNQVFVFGGSSLTENTLDLLSSNLPVALARLKTFVNDSNLGLTTEQKVYLNQYLDSLRTKLDLELDPGTLVKSTDIVAFLNTFEGLIQDSEYFDNSVRNSISSLNNFTSRTVDENRKKYYNAFNQFANSRMLNPKGTPQTGITFFDAAAMEYNILDAVLSANGENWSAFSSDTSLVEGFLKQRLYEAENKTTQFYNNLDLKDDKGKVYPNWVSGKIVIDLNNQSKAPEDTFFLLNDKIGVAKIAGYQMEQDDEVVVDNIKSLYGKTFKKDIQLTKLITLKAGESLIGFEKNEDDTFTILLRREKKLDATSKLALFQAKVGKGSLAGNAPEALVKALGKANIEADILYSARNFDLNKASPLFSANASSITIYDIDGKEISKISLSQKVPKNAAFAVLTSPLAVVEDGSFWNSSLKTSRLDETTIANNSRSLTGMVLLGNRMIKINDQGEFVYDNDELNKINDFWKSYKAPLIADQNAMRMHHLNMLTVLLSKIPTSSMSDANKKLLVEKALVSSSFASRSGLELINSLYKKHILGNGLNMQELKLNAVEKLILSKFMYNKFLDNQPIKTLDDAKEIKSKSGLYKDIRVDNDLMFGDVKVYGKTSEAERYRIDNSGKPIYVSDNTNGFYSMKNYVNTIINFINYSNPKQKPLSPFKNSDIENGTYKGVFNYSLGFINGYQTNKFRPISFMDGLVKENVLPNVSNNSNKTATPTDPIVLETGSLGRKLVGDSSVDNLIDYDKVFGTDSEFGKRNFIKNDVLSRFQTIRENKENGRFEFNRKALEENLDLTTDERFKFELMNALANTKTKLGRAALYGWAEDTYALSMSPKRLTFSPNDNQLHFVFDPSNKIVTADGLDQAIKDNYSSYKFFEYDELRKSKIDNTIENAFKDPNKEFFHEPDFMKTFESDIEDRLGFDWENALFSNVGDMTGRELFLQTYPDKAMKFVDMIAQRSKTFLSKGDDANMSYMANTDLLESGGIRISDELGLSLNYLLTDVARDNHNFQRDLAMGFMKLHALAEQRGVISELNEFSKLLGLVSWVDHLTKLKNQNAKEAGKYTAIIDLHLKENKITYEEAKAKLDAFGKKNGDVVTYYLNYMDNMKMFAKTYSRLNDEVSDDWFWLVTPNIYNKAKNTKPEFIRTALFSYSKPDAGAITNMYLNYNFYDSMANTIKVLSNTAAYYNFSKRAIDMGVMENNNVYNFVSETIEKTIESYLPEVKGYRQDTTEYKLLLTQIKDQIPGVIKNDFYESVNSGELGFGLFGIYKQLRDFINNKKITYADAQEKYRLAENDPQTKEEMNNVMKAYSFSNDILASIVMKLKGQPGLIDTIYQSILNDANNKGYSVVDNRGRLIREDIGDYRMLGNFSSEYVKNIFKYYSPLNGGFKANIVFDALNGDLFYMNKSLAEHADKYFFTQKVPGKVKQFMLKSQAWATSLLMSSPIKLPDRFLTYTATDLGFLSLANPGTIVKMPDAINRISEYLQSQGKVADEQLQEYMKARGVDLFHQNVNALVNESGDAIQSGNVLKPYFDISNKALSLQHEVGRFAAWLAIMEDIKQHGGSAKFLGSAYAYKDTFGGFEDRYDADGKLLYSKEAQQALFVVGRQLGSTGDFPLLAKQLNGWFMFTTFPLAMFRWARGELKSFATATSELLFSADKRGDAFRFLSSQGLGVLGIYMVMNFLLSMIADATGVDEETEEDWKNKQMAPEIVKSILLGGKPVMTPFNSFNPIQVFSESTIAPFLPTKDNPDKTLLEGLWEFGLTNIASRGNPALRLGAEIMGGVDIIGGTIYDNSDKYSMWENVQRKLGAYVIGAAGANALTNYLNKDLPYENVPFEKAFNESLSRVVMAELGNSRAYKSEVKNYYKANSIIQTWRFAERQEIETTSSFGNDFNLEGYRDLKSEIASAMNRKAKPTQIYAIISRALENGLTLKEVRSAVNNNSLQYKLNSIKNFKAFTNSLTEGELNTIKDSLAYEEKIYPWLDATRLEIEDAYRKNYYRSYSPRPYFRTYGPGFPRRQNYFNNNSRYYNSSNYYPSYYKENPFAAYRSSWFNLYGKDKDKGNK